MDLLSVVNQIVQNNLAAQQLTDLVIGTVTSADPLEIQISPDMPPFPKEVLLLTETVDGHLSKDDKVLMLRVMRGQQFIVLSHVV